MYRVHEIENFIELFREAVPNAKQVFTEGNCTSFALILNRAFPGGQVLHNLDHAVYKYNGLCYDITGNIAEPEGSIPIEEYGIELIKQLLKNNY